MLQHTSRWYNVCFAIDGRTTFVRRIYSGANTNEHKLSVEHSKRWMSGCVRCCVYLLWSWNVICSSSSSSWITNNSAKMMPNNNLWKDGRLWRIGWNCRLSGKAITASLCIMVWCCLLNCDDIACAVCVCALNVLQSLCSKASFLCVALYQYQELASP